MVKRILIVLLQVVILKVCLSILSNFTVIFPRLDRLRIKYKSQILACKQKQRCGWLGPFKLNKADIKADPITQEGNSSNKSTFIFRWGERKITLRFTSVILKATLPGEVTVRGSVNRVNMGSGYDQPAWQRTYIAGSRIWEHTRPDAFVPIATVHPYCARKLICHVMHRARALSTKMNNDRADGHCYS